MNLEDAVISWEEMRLLLGAQMKDNAGTTHEVKIHKNAQFVVETANKIPVGKGTTDVGVNDLPTAKPAEYKWVNFTQGTRGQVTATQTLPENSFKVGDRVRIFWVEEYAEGNEAADANMLVISPNRFPGVYKVVGDALIRDEDGHDSAFQFVIERAKLLSEVTLTLQAEGDPSTNLLNVEVKAA